ncbi:MAG: tRNA 2-thiouridine(34) synthase MnmA [Patescibacteria group bacterium]
MNRHQTVFVGVSGGVDSSVAALRLKKQGYNVVGVFIKVWHPDFMMCNWEAERLDAMRVAAHLEIPFLTCDAVDAYRDEVAHYFIEEYKAGRTPNPDVLCNKEIKFGAFLRFAKEHGADYIATGHYAQKLEVSSQIELHRSVDNNKDQSYFLWSLTPAQLEYSLFPIGSSEKSVIRSEAEKAGLPTATKKDSQGVCFLGHIDIKEFLSHYTSIETGDVLDETGAVIGTHDGALIYTVGQRHGFYLSNKDVERSGMYVVAKDLTANTITVAKQRLVTNRSSIITLKNVVLRKALRSGDTLEAQFRYRQSPFKILVTAVEPDSLSLETLEAVEAPAAGQSCVIYSGSHCLGGGILS